MTALILKIQKKVGQFYWGYFFPQSFLADLVILAVQAVKGAARKKNRPRSFKAGEGRFLSEMGQGLSYLGQGSLPAKTSFSICPVYPA